MTPGTRSGAGKLGASLSILDKADGTTKSKDRSDSKTKSSDVSSSTAPTRATSGSEDTGVESDPGVEPVGQSTDGFFDEGWDGDAPGGPAEALDTGAATFIGRSKFIQIVQGIIEPCVPSSAITVIVPGPEASGRTEFLQELRRRRQPQQSCIFVSFLEDDKQSHPYTGFWRGLNSFLSEFLQKIKRPVSISQGHLLVMQTYLPCLTRQLDDGNNESIDFQPTLLNRTSLSQVDSSLIALFRWIIHEIKVSQHHPFEQDDADSADKAAAILPLLLLLDDLQFSTPQARLLIRRLQHTFRHDPLAVVVTCHPVHEFCDVLASWLLQQKQAGSHIKRLPNWSYNNIREFLRRSPDWKNEPHLEIIAQVVYERTKGHVGSVLALVHVANGMHYKAARSISAIPMPLIEASNETTEVAYIDGSVVMHHLIKVQFRALPDPVRIILQVAAVYSPLFGAASIGFLVQQPSDIVHQQLSYACERSLLQAEVNNLFKFRSSVRHVIRTALTDTGKFLEVHWLVGQRLRKFLSQRTPQLQQDLSCGEETTCFLQRAADHLNIGVEARRDAVEGENPAAKALLKELAELNARAADTSLIANDYFAAREYLTQAINYLGATGWQAYHTWMIILESKRAEASFRCGSFEQSEKSCRLVMQHAKSYSEKKAIIRVYALLLVQQHRSIDAVDLIIDELAGLDEKFPTSFLPVQLNKQVKDLRKRLAKFCWSGWSGISKKVSASLAHRMNLIERLVDCTYLNGSLYHPMALLRAFHLIIDHGPVFNLSSLCFIYWGSLLREMGNMEESLQFARYGLELAQAGRHQLYDARALVIYYSTIGLWVHNEGGPDVVCLRQTYQPFWSVHDVTNFVVANQIDSFWSLFTIGSHLADLEADFDELITSLHDHGQEQFMPIVAPWAHLVHSLRRPLAASAHGTQPTGELDELSGEAAINRTTLLCHMLSAFFSYNIDLAEHIFNQLIEQMDNGSCSVIREQPPPVLFFIGLVSLQLAARHNAMSKRYRNKAISIIRKLDGHVKRGASNCHHYTALLRAQYLAYKTPAVDLSQVMNAFDGAIAAAQNRNAVLIRALACERTVLFLLGRRAKSTAVSYLKRSISSYGQWGAYGKVKHMKERYGGLMEPGLNC